MPKPVTPLAAADAIIEIGDKIVLIERGNEPPGFAIPGGFMDLGESAEQAAAREAKEETGLDVELVDLLYVYSDPRRDPRSPVITCTFITRAEGEPRGMDDAKRAMLVDAFDLPADIANNLAFDHAWILDDYRHFKRTGERPSPRLILDRLQRPLNS